VLLTRISVSFVLSCGKVLITNYIGEHELLPEDGIFNFFATESGGKVGRT
jgi:hypothetical protein